MSEDQINGMIELLTISDGFDAGVGFDLNDMSEEATIDSVLIG